MHKTKKNFARFAVKSVDNTYKGAILKLAPGNAGSHQVLFGEPPLANAQGEVEKNRKTIGWSGNEDGSFGNPDSVRFGGTGGDWSRLSHSRRSSGERTAIDGTRWRTQVAGQVEDHGFDSGCGC